MTFPFDFSIFVVAAAVVGGAYVIFGISAFGAALFTVPILSHFLPLDFVLPMCVLLDVAAAFALGTRISRSPACGWATASTAASRAPEFCAWYPACCS